MCRAVKCRTCGGVTWSGCGQHADEVLRGYPKEARCTCDATASTGRSGLFSGLFRRR